MYWCAVYVSVYIASGRHAFRCTIGGLFHEKSDIRVPTIICPVGYRCYGCFHDDCGNKLQLDLLDNHSIHTSKYPLLCPGCVTDGAVGVLNVSLDLLQDDHQTTLLSQAVNQLPGVVQMAESQTFYFPMQDGRVVNVDAYSTPLLNALGMRDSQGQRIAWNVSVQDSAIRSGWMQLKGCLADRAAIPLLRSAHEPLLYPGISFYVAGHLNYRNAVVRLSGMQPRSTLEDIMDMSGDVYHMVTVADWMEGLTEYRADATITRCLQLEGPSKDYIKSLDAEVRSKAIGFVQHISSCWIAIILPRKHCPSHMPAQFGLCCPCR